MKKNRVKNSCWKKKTESLRRIQILKKKLMKKLIKYKQKTVKIAKSIWRENLLEKHTILYKFCLGVEIPKEES